MAARVACERGERMSRHGFVRAALDEFETAISSTGLSSGLDALRRRLAIERQRQSPESWRTCCEEVVGHPALHTLLQDPYSRDARRKPSGYPGDARTLDYVYLRSYGDQAVSEAGQALFALTTGVPIASAVRDRCRRLADHIADDAARHRTVVSVACGHARELDLIPAGLTAEIRFWGIDHDEQSVASARRRRPGDCFEVGSVRALLQGIRRLPPGDLVYASGLFDYLDDRLAVALLKRMFQAVAPGGRVIVANLTPANDEIAYMEAVMDWWMCYRDQAALLDVARSAGLTDREHHVTAHTTSDGRVAWLQIDRAS